MGLKAQYDTPTSMLTLKFKAPTQNTFLYVQQTNQIRDKMQKKLPCCLQQIRFINHTT